MNIEQITGFPRSNFDVVFSSNALEHVPNVYPFFSSAWELLKPDGCLIIAVPPVVDELSRQSNLGNPYHLNIWTPHQWFYILSLYFSEVQPYLHGFDKPGVNLDFDNTPEQTQINETDFFFPPIKLDEFTDRHTLTVIFVARQPKTERDLPDQEQLIKFIDDSFTRPPQTYAEQDMDTRDSKFEMRRLVARSWEVARQDGLRVVLFANSLKKLRNPKLAGKLME